MEKRLFFLLVLLVLSNSAAFAQSQERQDYKYSNFFDLALSASPGRFSGAVSVFHLHDVALNRKLKLGYGVRFTSFVAANKFYTTAPSKYTSPVQNLGTIFSKNIDENIDTVTTATGVTNSLNVSIYIEYAIIPRLDVGFNIDAIGFSFGPSRQFNIISSSFDPNQTPVQHGAPTRFNVLLTSDNDIGSLNSELYLRYWLTRQVGLRLGFTFLFSEYRTDQPLSFNNGKIMNDRYRHKAGMGMFAVTYKPFDRKP